MMSSAKQVLRKEMKKALASLSSHARNDQSSYITNKLCSSEEYMRSKRIGVYLSMDEEVNTEMIVRNIFNDGKECFIPRYNKDEMVLVRLHSLVDLEQLPKTKWNIKQPLEEEERENALSNGGLDLILIPGLAFTLDGRRLGRGKGYYDKFLKEARRVASDGGKGVRLVALAFKEQVVKEIPVNDHDIHVHQVLYKE